MKLFIASAILIISSTVAVLSQNNVPVGSAAPVFSATAIDGSVYDMNELRGKVVVITFWSTRCEVCRAEFPKLNKLIQNHQGKDSVFLAVTMNQTEQVNAYLRQNPLRAAVLADNFGIVMQYADRDAKGYVNMGFPSYFVVDKQGVVRHRSSGFDRLDQLETLLAKLGG